VLVEFLADTFRFEGVLPAIERFKDGQSRLDECVIGEDAPEPDGTFIGVNGNEGVDAVFRPDFMTPATFRRGSAQAGTANFPNLHG
jgi:hypothetical protein